MRSFECPGQTFIDWLISPEGQRAIADYKVDGKQLFFPNATDPNGLSRLSTRGVTVDAQQAFCSCLLNWGTRHVAV